MPKTSLVRRVLPWLGLSVIVLVAVLPLGRFPPRGHDTLSHFYRVAQINALWARGVWFSRWAPDLMFGYGYPLFNFYPPLSAYWLTAVYWLVGQHAPLASNVAYGLTIALAALGMFRLAREYYGSTGGWFAASAYVLSPHLLYQTYERGSISNALALGFLPWVLLALWRVARAPTVRRLAWAALAFALMIMAHPATSLLWAAPLGGLGLVVALGAESGVRFRRALAVGLALMGGLMLAAAVWLPALAELPLTHNRAANLSGDYDFSRYFAEFLQWPEAVPAEAINPPLPINPGLGQLALGGLGLGVCGAALVKRRRPAAAETQTALRLSLAVGVIAFGAVGLAAPLSTPVWQNLPFLRIVQFPWRWLDVALPLLALLCGYLAHSGAGNLSWQRTGLLAAAGGIFFFNAVPYWYPPRWYNLPEQPSLADVTRVQERFGLYGLMGLNEFMPLTAPRRPGAPPFPGADEGAALDMKLRRAELPSGAVLAASGGPLNAAVRLQLSAATPLVFDTFYFPGWAARVDGQGVEIGPNPDGFLTLTVPAGVHSVSVYFGSTPVRTLAEFLSLITAMLVGLALVFPRRWLPQRVGASQSVPSGRPPEPAAQPCDLLPQAFLIGLLLVLGLVKFFWLDRFDSPWVYFLRAGAIQGTTAPEWRNFGGELELAGYRVDRTNRLTLYWLTRQAPRRNYTLQLVLSDARGGPLKTVTQPNPGASVTTYWEAGQLVRDVYTLPLDFSQRPSGYWVSVALLEAETGEPVRLLDSPGGAEKSVRLGPVKLAPEGAARPNAPAVDAVFAESLALTGARVPESVSAGGPLTFTLFWKSLAVVAEDYTVFVHVLGPDGVSVAGGDSQPRGGLYPTSLWAPGELIADEHQVTLAVPPGEYALEIGLYQLATGERLAVSGAAATASNSVILKTIRVEP